MDLEELEEEFTTKQIPVHKLRSYEFNYKIHNDEQICAIAKSIKDNGWTQPLVVDKHNVVVIGHGRLMAAKRLGLKRVPVVVKDKLTDSQIKALRIIDNELNSKTSYDIELKKRSLEEIPDIDLGDYALELEQKAKAIETEAMETIDRMWKEEGLDSFEIKTEEPEEKKKEDIFEDENDDNEEFDFLEEKAENKKKEKVFLINVYCSSFDEQLDVLNYLRSKGVKSVIK